MSYGGRLCWSCETAVIDDATAIEVKFDQGLHRRFCSECAVKIHNAYEATLARGPESRALETTSWADRDAGERLEALEEEVRKIKSVWRLWLTDARRGSINHGTFDAMRTLLGMAHHE